MAARTYPKGYVPPSFRNVMKTLQKEIKQIHIVTRDGLAEAAKIIRIDTEKTPPITPKDKGNLIASWFAVTTGKGLEVDPIGKSGNFKDNPGRKITAGEMAARHQAEIAEQLQYVNTLKEAIGLAMGYSAGYAIYPHENEGADFTRPDSGARWFEQAVQRNADVILKAIKDKAKI
jgi:hypothetical protein